MEYFCFWLTQQYVIPINKNIGSYSKNDVAIEKHEAQAFIGLANYYQDLRSIMPHLIQPLTK